jgi:hypothetical protein
VLFPAAAVAAASRRIGATDAAWAALLLTPNVEPMDLTLAGALAASRSGPDLGIGRCSYPLALGAFAATLYETIVGFRRRRPVVDRQPPTLEKRLNDLGSLMRSAALVLEEVQAEIQTRVAVANTARQAAEEAERLAALNATQQQAVARLVRAHGPCVFAICPGLGIRVARWPAWRASDFAES